MKRAPAEGRPLFTPDPGSGFRDISIRLVHTKAEMFRDREDILVAAPTHIHANDVIFRQFGRDLDHMGQRMAGLKRGDDAFPQVAPHGEVLRHGRAQRSQP